MKHTLSAIVLLVALAPAPAIAQAVTAPARDARGIPVVSNPVPQALMGYTGTNYTGGTGSVPTTSGGTVPTPMVTTNYPPCTRTVTDGCRQAYERAVRR